MPEKGGYQRGAGYSRKKKVAKWGAMSQEKGVYLKTGWCLHKRGVAKAVLCSVPRKGGLPKRCCAVYRGKGGCQSGAMQCIEKRGVATAGNRGFQKTTDTFFKHELCPKNKINSIKNMSILFFGRSGIKY